jgi:hypothetical protein
MRLAELSQVYLVPDLELFESDAHPPAWARQHLSFKGSGLAGDHASIMVHTMCATHQLHLAFWSVSAVYVLRVGLYI